MANQTGTDLPRSAPHDLCLVDVCADFYHEIAQIKRAIKSKTLDSYLAADGMPPPVTPLDYAHRVSMRLLTLLRQQERDIQLTATLYEMDMYRQARYLMAALADEIFILELQNAWAGSAVWTNVLLEQKLFQSNVAGSQVFTMTDALLQTSSKAPMHIDLAELILITLTLGFQGRYRDTDGRTRGQKKLAEIRKKLFIYAKQKTPLAIIEQSSASGAITFLPAYDHVVTGSDQRLGSTSQWKRWAIYFALGYLGFALLAWSVLIHPFENYIKS